MASRKGIQNWEIWMSHASLGKDPIVAKELSNLKHKIITFER